MAWWMPHVDVCVVCRMDAVVGCPEGITIDIPVQDALYRASPCRVWPPPHIPCPGGASHTSYRAAPPGQVGVIVPPYPRVTLPRVSLR